MRNRPRSQVLRFWAALVGAFLLSSAPLVDNARAIMPTALQKALASRYHAFIPAALVKSAKYPQDKALAALGTFRRTNGSHWDARFDPRTGALAALMGGRFQSSGRSADEAARNALARIKDLSGIDPTSLALERQASALGVTHLLYSQSYHGIPVEFSRVKVHMKGSAVVGIQSGYEPDLALPLSPAITRFQAAAAVRRQTGLLPSGGTLVILSSRIQGAPKLAWKIRARSRVEGEQIYYVDAQTGLILFSYGIRQSAGSVVQAYVYTVDPSSTPLSIQGMPHERIYEGSPSTYLDTDSNGGYSPTGATIYAFLQGPYVNVANALGYSASYQNTSGGSWQSQAQSPAVSSPHPYPDNYDSTTTIRATAGGAVALAPVFSALNVGGVYNNPSSSDGGAITDDDEVLLYDASGGLIASYVGDMTAQGSFQGAGTAGTSMNVVLKSNASGQNYGYDIDAINYLVLSGSAGSTDFTWFQSSYTYKGLHSEISAFYQLNLQHDYLKTRLQEIGADSSMIAAFDGPCQATVLMGPSLINSFYDPQYNHLDLGDVSDISPVDYFADDGTIPRHEYTHYMVGQIWPILGNFGQAGAISEANADYFSATSLNDPDIGSYLIHALGSTSQWLRTLDDQGSCPNSPCAVLSDSSWSGEVHADSLFLSQALWDVRKSLSSSLGPSQGIECSDDLEMAALFYFPDSFEEMYEAQQAVAQSSQYTGLGCPSATVSPAVSSAFTTHGIIQNSYPNSGFQTAMDISTYSAVIGTIAYAGQANFYTFGAGSGPLSFTLTLPPSPDGSGYYEAYMMQLYDVNHNLLVQANPPYNGYGDSANYCSATDCTTTDETVTLSYQVSTPGQFFLEVSGGQTGYGSNSGVYNASSPYVLTPGISAVGALSGSIVDASYDNDEFSFNAAVPDFNGLANYGFAYAQLRDQAQAVMPQTRTDLSPSYLQVVSVSSSPGKISGLIKIQTPSGICDGAACPDFNTRFPAVGTIYLEIFAYNKDSGFTVGGSTVSLGLSQALNLAGTQTVSFSAWNNVFNPLQGQMATLKYSIAQPGRVTIKLYTMMGRLVDTLLDNDFPAGEGSVDWTGKNAQGRTVASGVYLAHIMGPGLSSTQKIVIVK